MWRMWLKRISVIALAFLTISALDWFVMRGLIWPFKVFSIWEIFPAKTILFEEPVKGELFWFPGYLKLTTPILRFKGSWSERKKHFIVEYYGIFNGTGEVRFNTDRIVILDGNGQVKVNVKKLNKMLIGQGAALKGNVDVKEALQSMMKKIEGITVGMDWYFMRLKEGRYVLDVSIGNNAYSVRMSIYGSNEIVFKGY